MAGLLNVIGLRSHGSKVALLMSGEADLNVIDRRKWSPLHATCDAGHGSVVTMLIDGGTDIDVTDRGGKTPLHGACSAVNTERIQEASLEIMCVLILAGADVQARDSEGRLPMDMLPAWDDHSREVYEEAVMEIESRALKPVLK
jgi:ankyrin repeat protein